MMVVLSLSSSQMTWASYQSALESYYQGRYAEANNELDGVDTPNVRLLKSLIQLRLHDPAGRESFKSVAIPPIGSFERVLKFWFIDTANVSEMATAVQALDSGPRASFGEPANLELARAYVKAKQYRDALVILKRLQNSKRGDIRRDAGLIQIRVAIEMNQKLEAEQLYRKFLMEYPTGDRGFETLIMLNKRFGSSYGVLDILGGRASQLVFVRSLFSQRASYDFNAMVDSLMARGLTNAERQEFLVDRGILQFEASKESECIETMAAASALGQETRQSPLILYYTARSYQKLKKYNEAKGSYIRFVETNPKSDLAPAAYYYLYWVCQELNCLDDYAPYLRQFKSLHTGSIFYDKLMWEFGWNAYLKKDYATAFDIFGRTDWKFESDISAKVSFWLAKSAEHLNSGGAMDLFRKVLDKHPYTYYGYRVASQFFPDQISGLSGRFKPSDLQIDPLYRTMLSIGLADMAAEDLDYRVSRLRDRDAKTVVTLAYLYTGMLQNHRAINLLTSLGFAINPKEPRISREIAQLLYPRPYWGVIQRYSAEFNVDPYLILALMREESLFNPKARSRTGALGLMQIMPSTGAGIAKGLKMEWSGPDVLLIPEKNIRLGISYVASLKQRFNNNPVLMLSGYNAGPNATRRWLERSNGSDDIDVFVANIPYSETHFYVTRVLKSYWVYRLLYDPEFVQSKSQ